MRSKLQTDKASVWPKSNFKPNLHPNSEENGSVLIRGTAVLFRGKGCRQGIRGSVCNQPPTLELWVTYLHKWLRNQTQEGKTIIKRLQCAGIETTGEKLILLKHLTGNPTGVTIR